MSTQPTYPVAQATTRILSRAVERKADPGALPFGRLVDAIELGDPKIQRQNALVDLGAWCIEQLAEQRQEATA